MEKDESRSGIPRCWTLVGMGFLAILCSVRVQ
jgi:hypothetical protein